MMTTVFPTPAPPNRPAFPAPLKGNQQIDGLDPCKKDLFRSYPFRQFDGIVVDGPELHS